MPHIHEKIDFTAETFIVYQNKVLLRLHDKYHFWCSVGGHIELDEDPTQAAVREVKEEVGLDITLVGTIAQTQINDGNFQDILAPRYMNRHRINDTHEHVTFVFFGTCTTDLIKPEKPTDQWHWFTQEELDDPQYQLRPNIAFYAKEALKIIS